MTRILAIALILPATCAEIVRDPCSVESVIGVIDSVSTSSPDQVLRAGQCWIEKYPGAPTQETESLRSALEVEDPARVAPALVECDRQAPEVLGR